MWSSDIVASLHYLYSYIMLYIYVFIYHHLHPIKSRCENRSKSTPQNPLDDRIKSCSVPMGFLISWPHLPEVNASSAFVRRGPARVGSSDHGTMGSLGKAENDDWLMRLNGLMMDWSLKIPWDLVEVSQVFSLAWPGVKQSWRSDCVSLCRNRILRSKNQIVSRTFEMQFSQSCVKIM